MFAVIKTGGKQYKVSKGTKIWIEKIDKNEGDEVEFSDVLMVADEKGCKTGSEAKATVNGKVLSQGRRKKIYVFKQIRRKRYRRTQGHRQYFTAVEITDIKAN